MVQKVLGSIQCYISGHGGTHSKCSAWEAEAEPDYDILDLTERASSGFSLEADHCV